MTMHSGYNRKGLVFTTVQAWYSKDKKNKTREYIELANKILPFLKTKLNFSDDVKVVVSFTKGKRNLGWYNSAFNTAVIDSRQPYKRFINSMIHELVHAQQHHLGQLAIETYRGGYSFFWNNKDFGKLPHSHAKYLALPWEVEARKVALELTKEVLAFLNPADSAFEESEQLIEKAL